MCVYICWSVRPFQRYAQTIFNPLHLSLISSFIHKTKHIKMSSAAARANKATMLELKLRRLQEHNHRLKEELARPRTMVSTASLK
jgi:hypothetical protein